MANDPLLVNTDLASSSSTAADGHESNGHSSPDSGVNDLSDGLDCGASSSHASTAHSGGDEVGLSQQQSSPLQQSSLPQQSPPQQQHVVHVHVNPGETFRVRMGNQMQQIKGPATVRMVSSSGPPPLPMPLQVPPGHMVQQIIDENGVLTHVILSPQPPPHNMQPPQHGSGPAAAASVAYLYGGNSGVQSYYPAFSGQYAPAYHHHPIPTTMPPSQLPHGARASSSVGGAGSATSASTGIQQPQHVSALDERTARKKKQLQERLQKRGHGSQQQATMASASVQSAPSAAMPRWKGANSGPGHKAEALISELPQSRASFTSAVDSKAAVNETQEEACKLQLQAARDALSRLPLLNVVTVEARGATVRISPPQPSGVSSEGTSLPTHAASLPSALSDFLYDMQICERLKDGKYKTVYSGDATEITLQDLKPATDYCVKVVASLLGLRGPDTEPAIFTTAVSIPDPPQAPKMSTRSRSYIVLKWPAAVDNGSKVLGYLLKIDQGNGKYSEIFDVTQRSHKVPRLAPSTGYYFRLAAYNAAGESAYSEAVQYFTSGSLPEPPEAPRLTRAASDTLVIAWVASGSGEEQATFNLQMEDEVSRHGFLTVYNGAETSFAVAGLQRNSDYKFRLCVSNEEGPSKWSPIVVFRTMPDSPRAPGRPQTKGKVHPTSFRLTWDPPRDCGGCAVEAYVAQLDYGADFEEVYSGSACECMCSDLLPGFTYRARVACRSAAGLQSLWSDLSLVATPPVAPAACPAPRLHGKPKTNSVDIRWSPPDYDGGSTVTEYKVQLAQGSSGEASAREAYHGLSSPGNMACTVAGLAPGNSYLVYVKAINKAGDGPWSEPLALTSGASAPDRPAPPACHVRSPVAVLVAWQEPAANGSPVVEYRLQCCCSADTSQAQFTQVHAGPGLSYEVKGLSPATVYNFAVEAVNSAGCSEASDPVSCTTPPSVPGVVTGVVASCVTATSVHLHWSEAAANGSTISSYEVDFGDKQPMCVSIADADGVRVAHDCELLNLHPLTNYKVRVRAVNAVGCGPYSVPPVKVTTRRLPPCPPCLECVGYTSNSIKLKWADMHSAVARSSKHSAVGTNDATGGSVTYTLIMLRDNKSPVTLYTGTSQMHKVNRLTESTLHKFQVYATNEAGDGELSEELCVHTARAPPPALKAPSVTHTSSAQVVIAWQPCPLRTCGDDIVYVVQVERNALQEEHKSAASSGDGIPSLGQHQPSCTSGSAYKEVYRGCNLEYVLANLEPATSYHVRVAAVRHCIDDSNIPGAFSQPAIFVTQALPVTAVLSKDQAALLHARRTPLVAKAMGMLQAISSWPLDVTSSATLIMVLFWVTSIVLGIILVTVLQDFVY